MKGVKNISYYSLQFSHVAFSSSVTDRGSTAVLSGVWSSCLLELEERTYTCTVNVEGRVNIASGPFGTVLIGNASTTATVTGE